MKKQKRSEAKPVAQAPAQTQKAARWWSIPWWYWAVFLGALFLAFEAYGPALRGPFVLDDIYLPYADVNAPVHHLSDWVTFQRPLLMFSYWVDYQIGASDPPVYHTTNVLLHFVLSIVVMFIAARLLEWVEVAGRMRTALAIFAGALFLLHPLQTESVAYVASRSEVLSVLFYYAAFAVFIYSNRDSMTLLRAIADCRLVRRGGGNQGAHADAARADRADRFLVASRRLAKERISLRAAGAGGRGRSE